MSNTLTARVLKTSEEEVSKHVSDLLLMYELHQKRVQERIGVVIAAITTCKSTSFGSSRAVFCTSNYIREAIRVAFGGEKVVSIDTCLRDRREICSALEAWIVSDPKLRAHFKSPDAKFIIVNEAQWLALLEARDLLLTRVEARSAMQAYLAARTAKISTGPRSPNDTPITTPPKRIPGKIRCPFHQDRRPSLHIRPHPEKLGTFVFKCHGCGEKGVYLPESMVLRRRSESSSGEDSEDIDQQRNFKKKRRPKLHLLPGGLGVARSIDRGLTPKTPPTDIPPIPAETAPRIVRRFSPDQPPPETSRPVLTLHKREAQSELYLPTANAMAIAGWRFQGATYRVTADKKSCRSDASGVDHSDRESLQAKRRRNREPAIRRYLKTTGHDLEDAVDLPPDHELAIQRYESMGLATPRRTITTKTGYERGVDWVSSGWSQRIIIDIDRALPEHPLSGEEIESLHTDLLVMGREILGPRVEHVAIKLTSHDGFHLEVWFDRPFDDRAFFTGENKLLLRAFSARARTRVGRGGHIDEQVWRPSTLARMLGWRWCKRDQKFFLVRYLQGAQS